MLAPREFCCRRPEIRRKSDAVFTRGVGEAFKLKGKAELAVFIPLDAFYSAFFLVACIRKMCYFLY